MNPRRLAGSLSLLLLATLASPATARTTTLRQQVLDHGRAQGVDVSPLLERRIGFAGEQTTIGALLDRLDGVTTAAAGVTPLGETQLGFATHYAIKIGGGGMPALYTVSTSAVVPATPAQVVPIPATPASRSQALFEPGGSLTQIRGSGWDVGFHIAGGEITNVDTEQDGEAPVMLSGITPATVLSDQAVDFTGHVAAVTNSVTCFLNTCIGVSSFAGNGVAFYGPDLIAGAVPRPATMPIP